MNNKSEIVGGAKSSKIKYFENCTTEERISYCKLYNGDEKKYVDILGKFSVQITKEQHLKYSKYDSIDDYPLTKLDKILDVIREKADCLITYTEWFLPILDKTFLHLYTEMSDEMKTKYPKSSFIDNDIDNYRGCQIVRGRFTEQEGIEYVDQKVDVVLHDQNETIESLAWLLLHELGHVHLSYAPWGSLVSHSNYLHEQLNKDEYWNKYDKNDQFHEDRPEEVFCNMIANAWIGKKLDRLWWRENMSPNKKVGK